MDLDFLQGSFHNKHIKISGSKSESNRLLILRELYSNLSIENLSNADDTKVLEKIFDEANQIVDVTHAGTVMRFLTAFYAFKDNVEVVLKGSNRMHERPIKVLVDALCELGADIQYLEKKGFPPLKIKGKRPIKSEVAINSNVSSQFISALLLIAPTLPNGLTIHLLGKLTSRPYIEMTLSLLNQIGVKTQFRANVIEVFPKDKIEDINITVESDWSSASYWYSVVALSEVGTELTLSSYKKDSLQGDSFLKEIYTVFGVESKFDLDNLYLRKTRRVNKWKLLTLDLNDCPDVAQTIVVTCLGLGLPCLLKGLHTLKIKETDRLLALKTEIEKFGAVVYITNDSLELNPMSLKTDVVVETYNDHRMAMAFAPLSLKVPLHIANAKVVSKSYPSFWEDFCL